MIKDKFKIQKTNITERTNMLVNKNTLKAFIRKNRDQLFISTRSKFDGMTDGCEPCTDKSFRIAKETTRDLRYTLGIEGAYFTNSTGTARDFITKYEDNDFIGYNVSNCCGYFILTIKKQKEVA